MEPTDNHKNSPVLYLIRVSNRMNTMRGAEEASIFASMARESGHAPTASIKRHAKAVMPEDRDQVGAFAAEQMEISSVRLRPSLS